MADGSGSAVRDDAPARARSREALDCYLSHFGEVEGWLSPTTALGMAELLWAQKRIGVAGNVAEIGIHHGKSALPLAIAMRPTETLFAIDVFEHQEFNADGSGRGDREIFERNLVRFAPGAKVSLICESSDRLRGREREFGLLGLRFMSIDGGHTRALTLNDLEVADTCLSDAGICCLDDVFSPHWPGVVTGLFDFMARGGHLVPFCVFPNKLFLSRPERAGAYREVARERFPKEIERRDVELRGFSMDVIGERRQPASRSEPKLAAKLQEKDAFLQKVMEEKAESERTLANHKAALSAVLTSRSWRVTAPLRAIGGAARKLSSRLRSN